MIRRLLPFALLGVLLLAGCVPPPPPTSATRTAPEIGCFAPDLVETDVDGETIDLSKYRGKVVVLDFWFTTCPPCRSMIPKEKELVSRMQGRPFAFLAVSIDKRREMLTKFLEKDPHPWPDIHDARGKLSREWEVESCPTFFIIDAKGIIRYRVEGMTDLEGPVEKLVREVEGR